MLVRALLAKEKIRNTVSLDDSFRLPIELQQIYDVLKIELIVVGFILHLKNNFQSFIQDSTAFKGDNVLDRKAFRLWGGLESL